MLEGVVTKRSGRPDLRSTDDRGDAAMTTDEARRSEHAAGIVEHHGVPEPVMSRPMLPTDIEARRRVLQPSDVRVLFVTAPIFPLDTTNFYAANSHLYRCVRGAFVRMLGPDIPQGEDFLWFFRDQGCWLYHVAPEPTRGPGRPRAESVRPTVLALANFITEARPDNIVGVKAKLRPRIREAARRAEMEDRVFVVATPRLLWEPQFSMRFRKMLGVPITFLEASAEDELRDPKFVHSIVNVLLDRSNKRQRARELVRLLEAKSNRRPGDPPLRKAQVSTIIRGRPDIFDVNSAGVRLRDGGDARGRRAATNNSRRG
jgi:hypothetical protein